MLKSKGEDGTATVKVWDPFVRVFHWGLVAGFALAYLTEDDFLTLHIWAGYLAGMLIALRLPWGLIGPRHARFSDFVYRPSKIAAYLGDMLQFRARRCLGHSPAGGAMVVALMAVVAVTVATGIAANNGSYLTGGVARLEDSVTPATAMATTASASRDEDENEEDHEREDGDEDEDEDEGIWGELHEGLASFALALVIFHIIGVAVVSLAYRENLVRAMITGRKRADAAGHGDPEP